MRKFLLLLAISIIPTLLIWFPFFTRLKSFWQIPLPSETGMAAIVANYDGPLYLVVAKTFYDKAAIKQSFQFPLSTEYYAAHFPAFPFLTKIFSFGFGYPYALLLVTLAASVLAAYFFCKFARLYLNEKEALFLTLVFSIFPARWLIVKSVGSAEPLFVAAILASLYFFQRKKYLAAGFWGVLAQFTKPPAILLFAAYLMTTLTPLVKDAVLAHTKFKLGQLRKIWPILLIPLTLIAVFLIYQIRLGDFWAYFHSGDNINLFFPPFQIFNYAAPWVGTACWRKSSLSTFSEFWDCCV